MSQAIEASSSIKVSYQTLSAVERLLGKEGTLLLHRVLNLVRDVAGTSGWPLTKLEVRYIVEPEVKGWEYVLLVPVFSCSFDVADGYLHELYIHIDAMGESLSEEESYTLQKLIFFDVEIVT